MRLNQISDNPGARKRRMRVGRGIGSTKGKTAGRGHKGQHARTGVALHGFEGGQMPMYRRLPKRGFGNPFRPHYQIVNLDSLQKAVDAGKIAAGAAVDAAALVAAGVIRHARDGIKLLGDGALKAKLTLTVARASKSALAAVEKAGGAVTITVADKPERTPEGKRAKARELAAKGELPVVEKSGDAKAGKAKAAKPKAEAAEGGEKTAKPKGKPAKAE